MVAKPQIDIGEYQYGFRDEEDYVFKSERGLTRETVEEISTMKDEPDWMREFRLKALDHFEKRPMPNWGADLSGIDFDNIFYYIRPAEKQGKTWDEVPEYIKNTFEKLGIPEAERKFLAGVGAQYEIRGDLPLAARGPREAGRDLPRHGLRRCASTRSWSRSTSARSSRPTTTSSPRSTRRSGRAARSSTCRRASRSTCRCRPTSASTPRTWASSSGR